MLESVLDAELNRLRSSPPPKFTFLKGVEDKLLQRLVLEAAALSWEIRNGGGCAMEECSAIPRTVVKNKDRGFPFHSSSSQVLPLTHDLDYKVRFGHKAVERPGSRAGRPASFFEKPLPQPTTFEGSRSIATELMERPRSHDSHVIGDSWTKQSNERIGFTRGHESGFIGNRDIDRRRKQRSVYSEE